MSIAFGEPITVGFQHVARLATGAFDPGEPRPERFKKIEVATLNVSISDEIASLDANIVAGLNELQKHILSSCDAAIRWHDTWTGTTFPLRRSPKQAKLFDLALYMIDMYHRDILRTLRQCGPAMAVLQIQEIIRANDLQWVQHPTWGGFTLRWLDAPPFAPEFPPWLVLEEINRLRPVFEHLVQRRLTNAEVNKVVREAAEERLRYKQNKLLRTQRVDLAEHESQKRSERRRRAKERHKRTLRAMEQAGLLWRVTVGQKHRWTPVPWLVPPVSGESAGGIRVAPERVRVAQGDEIELSADEATEPAKHPRLRALPR